MSREGWKHIFDNSSCLTKKQMECYMRGAMTSEEAHAAEVHMNSCSFCSEATDGLWDKGAALTMLNSRFLKEHFSDKYPQIHLNSIAASRPVAGVHKHRRRKAKKQDALSPYAVVAMLFLAGGVLWYTGFGKGLWHYRQASIKEKPVVTAPKNALPQKAGNAVLTDTITTPVVGNKEEVQPIAVNNIPAAKPSKTKNAAAAHSAEFSEQRNEASRVSDAPPKRSGFLELIGIQSGADQHDDDKLSKGDEHFEKKEYKAALHSYKDGMKSEDKGRRQEAGIMAAQSYINLGDKDKAAEILQDIIDEGGSKKRVAKRMLNDINEE